MRIGPGQKVFAVSAFFEVVRAFACPFRPEDKEGVLYELDLLRFPGESDLDGERGDISPRKARTPAKSLSPSGSNEKSFTRCMCCVRGGGRG